MNMLFNYYLDKNTIDSWVEDFSSAAQKVIMYSFKGTNGRSLTNFYKKYDAFKAVEGVPRSEWPVSSRTGQEVHKQYTAPMKASRLFYEENGIFKQTAKGKVYEKFLNEDLNEGERWFLSYMFLLDATFDNKDNYILSRSNEVYDILVKNTSEQFVEAALANLFIDRNLNISDKDIANYDFLYLDTFFRDPEFLSLYYNASEEDKKELQRYVSKNLEEKNRKCCICKKFVSPSLSTGNYTVNELIDDLKILVFSKEFRKLKYNDFEETINQILKLYEDYDINSDKLLSFLIDNKTVFEPILMNVFKVEDIDDSEEETEKEIYDSRLINVDITYSGDRPEPRIDDTTIVGKQQLRTIFAMRKKIAREKSNYSCELEMLNGCRYFTSKTTKHNYIEVHHFVPREFRNNFENSVDVLANYITLCPHCHRMIHLATDRERVNIIRYIYNQRKDRLKNCGIEVEFEDLLNFYNVENES